jgi:hypothetical protein
MNFDLNTGEWIVAGLSAFLFAWYFFATAANRKKGLAAYRWLRQGLEALGKVSRAEWIGAANMGARLVVKNARKPFRLVEAHYLLEPREFLPYWVFSRLRGRREGISIKVTLRSSPNGTLEIKRVPARQRDKIPHEQRVLHDFQILADDQASPVRTCIEEFLGEYAHIIDKIALQAQAPQLEIHARLKWIPSTSPESFFEALLACFQPT